MIQKFRRYDHVKFNGADAVVLCSLKSHCGSGSRNKYRIYLREGGESEWHLWSDLELVESGRKDLLLLWRG